MVNSEQLDAASRAHDHVFVREDLVGSVCSRPTLDRRCRVGGPWQRPLPGVVVTHNGPLTELQRLRAALLFAGGGAMLTGWAALRLCQVRTGGPGARVDVLVGHERRRADHAYVRLHRTRHLPEPMRVRGLSLAPLARAAADTLREQPAQDLVRTLLHELVQTRRCTVAQLQAELRRHRGMPAVAATLKELTGGARSAAEGQAQQVIANSGLPWPLWNAALYLDGSHLGTVDAYWPLHGVVLEIDSRQHHLAIPDWEHTMARHNRLEATGLRVLHISPHQLQHEPQELLAALTRTLASAPPGPWRLIDIRPA